MSNLFHPIDIYCERTSQTLLAEPLNALTNLAFIVAAIYLAKLLCKQEKQDWFLWWLTFMVGVIGLGSAAFHTVANRLTMWMDIIPIAIFLLSYIWVFARTIGRQSRIMAAAWLGLFLLLGYGVGHLPEAWQFNGTIHYSPALIYLLAMAIITHRKRLLEVTAYLRLAITTFLLSMTMRSVDMISCEWLPIGTHFLWHVCNGLVLYFVVKALIVHRYD